ncbi:hypothetical protein Pst134EA_028223 [Puccinia striiformis f. sp. tritici]|uniref:RRM domain-containing protein n=2 Tax=Puccinia striiformis TaxID=27350 RepID=A0A0L0VTV0_9BASI|nr:uncharacterized protein Pst134EA_032271 [Puccinia striiformis f. sp. tritici]XP_047799124.1 hypothetical protein Pst134EA_028223 [Puccinia striiformis f. sp. tritici]KNF02703.1 hypothetical protein PSTG_03989 [Puccinia striiformis f. sp. tritici PST-78]KAH9441782.1 hypothetical protein Pst134EA_032271 [Puccinia striiformis f. sp. tritici]KAH9442522.1 hypothetical protein Pst134EB_028773 [Puccinia striiformis f. sp. tritici]KAH9448934.1 hypothetical protein Pst134EA_028223 [Puccinia striifor
MDESTTTATTTALNIQSGSRVLISGLPSDVTGSQLHELFDQTVSQVNKVEVYCDQSGTSRGIALIEFDSLDSALRSHQQFHGKLIDRVSTITVEIVAVPASPAILEPAVPQNPIQPVRTTTIKPAAHYNQQPQQKLPIDHHQQQPIPSAPRNKNYQNHRPPPPSKLSLKQRLALPTPPPPRRFLFNTPANNTPTTTKKARLMMITEAAPGKGGLKNSFSSPKTNNQNNKFKSAGNNSLKQKIKPFPSHGNSTHKKPKHSIVN